MSVPVGARDESTGRYADLPGWELVSVGLSDLAAGRNTIEAMLIACAPERMARIGLPLRAL